MFHYAALHLELRNALVLNTTGTEPETANNSPGSHPIEDIFVAYIIGKCEGLGEFRDRKSRFRLSRLKRHAYKRQSDQYENNGPGFLIVECAYSVDEWYGTSISKDNDFYDMVNRLKAVLYKWCYEIEYDHANE